MSQTSTTARPALTETRNEADEKLLDLIDASGADPVIKGTTVNAYRIAALLEAMSVEHILRDYPSLDVRRVLAARLYAESRPKSGRPYPNVTAKTVMREARTPDPETFLPPRR